MKAIGHIVETFMETGDDIFGLFNNCFHYRTRRVWSHQMCLVSPDVFGLTSNAMFRHQCAGMKDIDAIVNRSTEKL